MLLIEPFCPAYVVDMTLTFSMVCSVLLEQINDDDYYYFELS